MPCSDGGVPYPAPDPTREEVLDSRTGAMLCALINVSESTVLILLEAIDEKAAGVTRAEIREWWDLHKASDRDRRQIEEYAKAHRTSTWTAARELGFSSRRHHYLFYNLHGRTA